MLAPVALSNFPPLFHHESPSPFDLCRAFAFGTLHSPPNVTLPTHPNVNTGAKVCVFVEDEKCQFDFQDVAKYKGRTYEAVRMGKFDLESKMCIQSVCRNSKPRAFKFAC